MLLSLTKRLRIELHPTRIVITTIEQGWKPAPAPSLIIHVEKSKAENGWHPVLQVLKNWLAEQPRVATNVDLVLSDHYVRYQLVPWHEDINTSDEIAALGRACFADAYGTLADGWEIQIDVGEYGAPGVACAIEQSLVLELRTAFSEKGMRLASLQPAFTGVFNRFGMQLGETVLFASVDGDRCVLACIKDGRWHSIRSLSCGVDIDIVLDRELLLQGLSADVPRHLHRSTTENDACVN